MSDELKAKAIQLVQDSKPVIWLDHSGVAEIKCSAVELDDTLVQFSAAEAPLMIVTHIRNVWVVELDFAGDSPVAIFKISEP